MGGLPGSGVRAEPPEETRHASESKLRLSGGQYPGSLRRDTETPGQFGAAKPAANHILEEYFGGYLKLSRTKTLLPTLSRAEKG
jgi:hypothetical protein